MGTAKSFDYIIVGAGSAGCVLANRLTEDGTTKVLLIEAGCQDTDTQIHIPAAFSKLFYTKHDWAYFTEPQPHVNNRKMFWPRGKMLGGCSSINAMIYIRGNRRDYDRWRDMGCEGWGFDDVLPYFKKSENQERGASEYHGVGGPLNVADQLHINPMSRAFVEAANQTGIPETADFNDAEQDGVGYYQVNQKGGRRHSCAAAFIKPALARQNLTIETDALTTSILIENGRAVGVKYHQGGQEHEARADGEVLLCGGAVNSPQVLMLSGIGPADHLQEHGIPVLADLPGVGKNLQDHLIIAVGYTSKQAVSLIKAESFASLMRYLLFKSGPLTSNVAEAGGFVKTRDDVPWANLQFHFAPGLFLDHGQTPAPDHGFGLGPTLLYPESRGTITLRSADPSDPPIIDPHYLEADADMQVLVEGIKLGEAICQAKAFDPFRGDRMFPPPGADDDEGIRAHIRNMTETLYHPVGTCKMGRDDMAVVDLNLKVHGVEGLRVIDASVMPAIVGGNTHAPTVMIAEKAADLIRG
jgi:choline dehydrogenase